jgi:DNA-binding response OmpR family regulator
MKKLGVHSELLVVGPSRSSQSQRCVFVVEEAGFAGHSLSRILARWNLRVLTASTAEDAARAFGHAERFDLAILPLPAATESAAARLQALRAIPAFADTPVLGIVALEGLPLDYDSLRKLGVVGVADRAATAEYLAFRVGQILPSGSPERRRHVRVPVSFAVELEAEGRASTERAEDLSCGGIRLCSSRALELNSEVGLRFRLPAQGSEPVATAGRVIHCRPISEGLGAYILGIFFLSCDPAHHARIEAEVMRLLDDDAAPESRGSAS